MFIEVATADTVLSGRRLEGVLQALIGGSRVLKNGSIWVKSKQEGFKGGVLSPTFRTAIGVSADNRLLPIVADRQRKG
ncbi:MAG: phosphodiester glycosidase family protein [bacterium]|nr:phosphodiester glycosidase family protein [bacterium]